METARLNPFRIESPEKLFAARTGRSLCRAYTQVGTVKQRKHTIIWVLADPAKACSFATLNRNAKPWCTAASKPLLSAPNHSLVFTAPVKEGQFNKTDLDLLSPSAAQTLTEHMLNLQISDLLFNCFRTQFPDGFFQREAETGAGKYASLFSIKPHRNRSWHPTLSSYVRIHPGELAIILGRMP